VTHGLFIAALALLLIGAVLAVAGELRRREPLARAGAGALAMAWALEFAALTIVGLTDATVPLRSGAEYLLVLGWFVLTLHLYLWFRSGIRALALVLPPIALVMVAAAHLMPSGPMQAGYGPARAWFMFHTSVATAGMGALAVSFAMSVLFLVKDHALRKRTGPRLIERLPSLETVDRIGFQALMWGFPLLTIGIVTGMVYNSELHDRLWTWGLKEVFPVLAWGVFAVLLWARFARGIRGRRSAFLSIAGFALGLLTLFGMAH
jgi:ABC-type uncharacterized transport system permease subunit